MVVVVVVVLVVVVGPTDVGAAEVGAVATCVVVVTETSATAISAFDGSMSLLSRTSVAVSRTANVMEKIAGRTSTFDLGREAADVLPLGKSLPTAPSLPHLEMII